MDAKNVELSAVLSDRVRLLIVATLAASKEPLDFGTLLETLQLTKGNLSSHMRKLEEHGLVEVRKEFVDRKPRTTYAVSRKGRREVKEYLEKVEELLSRVR
jgi:DNA-binding transcriptional ArsR family regulator